MKNYIVSLSKRALLLSGALAIFTACDDGDLGDIYKGNSSGEYVSDVNWTDAADKSTGTYIKYFYENASGRDTFCIGHRDRCLYPSRKQSRISSSFV